jgi:hypothetical protein
MKPFIRITRNPYEEPNHIHLIWEVCNGNQKWEFNYYDNADALTKFSDNLEVFPRHLDDVFLWELGSEYQEDRWGYYFRFRVFVWDSVGHCAIQIRFNNNRDLPFREQSELCIKADAAQINRLGKLFRGFSELKHEVLIWEVDYEGLNESKHEVIKSDNDDKFTPEELIHPKESTKEILLNLTAREAEVLRSRFGINLSEDVDLENIGRQFDATRKRIKVIEENALKKLRSNRNKEQNHNCSFCDKQINDVKRMIKSEINNVYICNECIKTCGDLLDDQ